MDQEVLSWPGAGDVEMLGGDELKPQVEMDSSAIHLHHMWP